MYKQMYHYKVSILLCIWLAIGLCKANCQNPVLPDTTLHKLAQFNNDAERINFLLEKIEKSLDENHIKQIVQYISDNFQDDDLLLEKLKAQYWHIKLRLEGEIEPEELDLFSQELEPALYLINQKNGDSFWQTRFLALKAELAYRSENRDLADSLNEQALPILFTQNLNSKKQQSLLGDIYRIKGNLFYANSQLDSFFHYYQLAREAYQIDAERNNNKIITILTNLGIISGYNTNLGGPDTFYKQALLLCPEDDQARRNGIYIEWGISTAAYALNTDNHNLIYDSNKLLYHSIQSLRPEDSTEVTRLYYQLGANYQNLAKFFYSHSDTLFQSALDSAAYYYKQTIVTATDKNNKTILDKVYERAAQICDYIPTNDCENLLATMGVAYQEIFIEKEKVIKKKNQLEKEFLISKQKSRNSFNRSIIIILSLVILLLGVFSYAFIQRENFKNIRKNLQSRLEALRAQMNPHFISNSLNAIDSLVIQKKNDLASEYIVDFSRLCRMILDSSRTPLITLKKEVQILEHFLSLEKLRLPNRLNIIWDIDASLELETYLVPPLILQPFVENAIWHGILNKENRAAGLLYITIKGDNEKINCIIEDDGVGRKKAKAIRNESFLEWQSWGMQITNERIEALQKIKNSNLEIIDLYDDNNLGIGTKVIISLPKISKEKTI